MRCSNWKPFAFTALLILLATACLLRAQDLTLCGAPHNASNAQCIFMQS